MKPQLIKPVCFLMHGIPGAGKSAFARQFSEYMDLAHINSDRIRYELYDDAQFSGAENTTVWRLASYMAGLLLNQGQSVVFDMHLPTQTLRKTLRDTARDADADFMVIWVQTDYETAQYRAMNRDRRTVDDKYSFSLPENVHQRLSQAGSDPSELSTAVVSGKHIFRTQLGPVLRKLRKQKLTTDSVPVSGRTGRVDHERRLAKRKQ